MANPPSPQTCKTILFSLSGITFALPMNTVLRVTHYSQVKHSQLENAQLGTSPDFLYVDGQPWEVFDLAGLLSKGKPEKTLFYLLIQWSNDQGAVQQGAIAVNAPPVLMDLPLEQIHPVPATYRERLAGVAQYMVAIGATKAQEGIAQTQMIVLLELSALAQRCLSGS